MPRYYFRLTDGKQALDNHRGIDLPGSAATRTMRWRSHAASKAVVQCQVGIGQGGSSQSSISMDTGRGGADR